MGILHSGFGMWGEEMGSSPANQRGYRRRTAKASLPASSDSDVSDSVMTLGSSNTIGETTELTTDTRLIRLEIWGECLDPPRPGSTMGDNV